MDVKVEELQHEHPLTLVDLQLMHRGYEEDDEDYDDNDLIATQNFESTCNRCGTRIDWYHRYYYKCSMTSCNYSLHKFCEEMPTTLTFQGHPSHTLFLKKTTNYERCHNCLKQHKDNICYHCSTCNYGVDLLCATSVEQNTIHHPGHPHPLICVTVEPGLNKCFACGKKHEGYFYHCSTTCSNFLICSECLALPLKLLLRTKQFSHSHFLTLSYSFVDRLYDFECRICGMKLEEEHLIYKCSKCMYYVHPDCATQRLEPFMSILLPGLGKTEKNFKDVDHPDLLHFPLPDESHILSHQTEVLIGSSRNVSHEHPLILIPNELICKDTTSAAGTVFVHDSMKRIKLLCNACLRPITKMPFYKCSTENDCDFALHDWCAWLPKEVRNYVGHPQHVLELAPFNHHVFECRVCRLPCNGFSYRCGSCDYFIDVNCAFIPKEITHEAHANHLLTRVDASSNRLSKMECRACRVGIDESEIYFKCSTCDFYLDCRCALLLPKTMRHKFDKHPLELSYYPIEDHKSQYFCEICEEDLDPGKWFYHCVECGQSIHSACAPLILQSEQDVNSHYVEGVYKFINIKFGHVQKRTQHHHHMSFAPGTKNDGTCGSCPLNLHSHMIWKCLHCEFAQHYYTCTIFKCRLPISTHHSFHGKKLMITYGPQTHLKIYPSEVIRPVTRNWKVVDDMPL